MSRSQQHLQCRDGVWQFRLRVPDDLRPVVGKREIKHSLRTRDPQTAKRALPLELVKAHAVLDEARREVAGTRRVTREIAALSPDDLRRLMETWFVAALRSDVERVSSDLDANQIQDDISCLRDWDVSEPSFRRVASQLLEQHGIVLPAGSPSLVRLTELIQDASVERQRRLLARSSWCAGVNPDPSFGHLGAGSVLTAQRSMTVAQLVELFRSEPAESAVSSGTRDKRSAHYELVKGYFGPHTHVARVTREQARAFRDFLCRLPANAKKRFPNLSVHQFAELPAERARPFIKPETINACLGSFSRLFKFALVEGHVSADVTVKLLVRDDVRPDEKREPFTVPDLRSIFSAPLYVGCINDENEYAQPGDSYPRRGRFWVPLLSMFGGLRLQEACQLTEDDVVEVAGYDLVSISRNQPWKRLKNMRARRLVPIHPELVRLGFMDHVRSVRADFSPGSRLFPELTFASNGTLSNNFSKFYARFLDSRGIPEKGKAFHSFRHTFRDRLRAAGCVEERAQAIGGWSSAGTDKIYGGAPEVLAAIHMAEVSRLTFPGLDLSAFGGTNWPENQPTLASQSSSLQLT